MDYLECGVCYEVFNDDDRKPHTIDCGHTLCTICLAQIINTGKSCPECRKKISLTSVDEAPVSVTLLRLCEKTCKLDNSISLKDHYEPSTNAGTCEQHGDIPIQFYCSTCKKWICSTCALIDHTQPPVGDCYIMTITRALDRLQLEALKQATHLEESTDSITTMLKDFLERVDNSINDSESKVQELRERIEYEDKLLADFKETKSKFCSFLTNMKDQKNKIDNLMTELKSCKEFNDTMKCIEVVDAEIVSTEKLFSSCIEGMDYHNDCCSTMSKSECSILDGLRISCNLYCEANINGGKRWSQVTVEGSYLYLRSFQNKPPNKDANIIQYSDVVKDDKIPLAVLDISWNNSYRGRVVIKLNEKLKRSQNFKLLCTGEKGPTYKSTKFHAIIRPGDPGEQLRGGDYEHQNGMGGISLLPDMMDKELQSCVREEGKVFTTNPKVFNRQSQFGVCLKGEKDKLFYGHFGHVQSGLGILKDASMNMNSSAYKIYISECGILIPL